MKLCLIMFCRTARYQKSFKQHLLWSVRLMVCLFKPSHQCPTTTTDSASRSMMTRRYLPSEDAFTTYRTRPALSTTDGVSLVPKHSLIAIHSEVSFCLIFTPVCQLQKVVNLLTFPTRLRFQEEFGRLVKIGGHACCQRTPPVWILH
jgi:hypothetical protein